MMETDHAIRSYLLGRLTEGERERIEEAIFEDPDLFDAMRAVEGDLIADAAAGRLDPADEAAFAARRLATRPQIVFARALEERAARRNVVPMRRARYPWMAAAAIVVIAAGAALFVTRDSPETAPVIAEAPETPAAGPEALPAARVVAMTLTLGGTRSDEGGPAVLEIPSGTSEIELRVRLHPAEAYDEYRVELSNRAGDIVWRSGAIEATDAPEKIVVASIPAEGIAAGRYEVVVTAEGDAIGFEPLEVRRGP